MSDENLSFDYNDTYNSVALPTDDLTVSNEQLPEGYDYKSSLWNDKFVMFGLVFLTTMVTFGVMLAFCSLNPLAVFIIATLAATLVGAAYGMVVSWLDGTSVLKGAKIGALVGSVLGASISLGIVTKAPLLGIKFMLGTTAVSSVVGVVIGYLTGYGAYKGALMGLQAGVCIYMISTIGFGFFTVFSLITTGMVKEILSLVVCGLFLSVLIGAGVEYNISGLSGV